MNSNLRKKIITVSRIALVVIHIQCMLCVMLLANNRSNAQYMRDIYLSVSWEDASMDEVFTSLNEKTGFRFLFNEKKINKLKGVSLKAQNQSLEGILRELSTKKELQFRRVNNTIAVKKFDKADKERRVLEMADVDISGKITDENGQGLPGASVVVKGTTNGTTSDLEGNYKLSVPEEALLAISFVGYITQEVSVVGRSKIDLQMKLDAEQLEEIVVVGYGTQKKLNLTGSVANIGSDDIKDKVASQTSQILAGELSGVTVTQNSGNPGKDGATIRVRGIGTFSNAGSSPLVLIDGIPGGIDDVVPSNIESVTVLKDAASAAIYGARAANGVILIKTKDGKREGGLRVNYNGYVGMQKPTEIPDLINSWEYAELMNEAALNEGGNIVYTDQDIENFRSQTDPVLYPNFNRLDWLLEGGNGLQTNHDFRFSGGTKENSYSLSLGYLSQNGIMAKNSYDRYNMRLNLNSQVSDKLNVSLKLSGRFSIQNDPVIGNDGPDGSIQTAIKLPPTIAGGLPDGTYDHVSGISLQAWFDSNSFSKEKEDYLLSNLNVEYEILDGLTINGVAGVSNNGVFNQRFKPEIILTETAILGPSNLTIYRRDDQYITLQAYLKYNKSFEKSRVDFLAGYSQEESISEWIRASRDDFPNNSLYQLNAASAENMQNSGSRSEWALRSYFTRLNYSFDDKYLFELNARYDGSSRFTEGKQYSIFPSASAAWRLSAEDFFDVGWINDFKIRASYGELGNQNIGLYPYQQTLSLGQSYVFGDQLSPGAATTTLPNRNLTWETTKVTDIGLDITFFENKLSLTTDYYIKRTEGILYNISSSNVLGLNPSAQNAGIVENRGFEIQLNHRNSIGKFEYEISPNFSLVHNEVISLYNVEEDIGKGLFVGKSLSSIYGYEADGLFIDDQDISDYPTQPYTAKPGYVRLKDISGPEGVPDGIVSPAYDRKVIGNGFPKYTFGGRIALFYNGFDLAIQLQGVGGVDDYLDGEEGLAFFKGSTPQRWMLEERWTPENPDRNAKYPRVENAGSGHPLNTRSTYWLRNASFLRINNLQFGYSIPNTLLDKVNISQLRFYFSGSNLLTFDGYYEGWDPEMTGLYPPTAAYTLGINLTF